MKKKLGARLSASKIFSLFRLSGRSREAFSLDVEFLHGDGESLMLVLSADRDRKEKFNIERGFLAELCSPHSARRKHDDDGEEGKSTKI